MARWFNIGGPCNPATNYMLSAMARLPEVAGLVRKQYFVVHAPRQCGKTTAFLSFANETNAKGDAVDHRPDADYRSPKAIATTTSIMTSSPTVCPSRMDSSRSPRARNGAFSGCRTSFGCVRRRGRP